MLGSLRRVPGELDHEVERHVYAGLRRRLQEVAVLVEAGELVPLQLVLHPASTEVDLLDVVELVHVDGYVVHAAALSAHEPLEYEEVEALLTTVPVPHLGREHIAGALAYLPAAAVHEHLVLDVHGRLPTEYLAADGVVHVHGVGDVLPVGLEPDVQGVPAGRELHLPA